MRLVGVVGAVKMGRPGAVKMGRPGAAKMGRPGTGGGLRNNDTIPTYFAERIKFFAIPAV